jgi:hypothetical protein
MGDSLEALPPDFEKGLASVGGLEPVLARVYALGLSRLMITTRDVALFLNCPQNTAGHHLDKLVEQGYFLVTPATKSGGGRGSGRVFRVVSPRVALADRLEAFSAFSQGIALIDEHLEIQASDRPPSSEIWKVASALLPRHLARSCGTAVHSIKVACNDLSWAEEPGAVEALVTAKKRGVKVEIFAHGTAKSRRRSLRQRGIRVRNARAKCPVFLLLDSSSLYLPFKEGTIAGRYSALYTSNDYLVKSHEDLFESLRGEKRE